MEDLKEQTNLKTFAREDLIIIALGNDQQDLVFVLERAGRPTRIYSRVSLKLLSTRGKFILYRGNRGGTPAR
jgi:hypothetical protein